MAAIPVVSENEKAEQPEIKKSVLQPVQKKINEIKEVVKKKTAKKVISEKIQKIAKSKVVKETVNKKQEIKVRGSEIKLLESLARPAIKQIFKEYDLKILAMALQGAGEELTDKVRSSIGQGAGRKLTTALNRIKLPKSKEVKEARRLIEEQIKKYFASKKNI
ncbi:MAG TPA: FliG C-terminal domain-containing protein [Bacteroidales bacterium]|nr:FliG C-terminal domain-containing protein [Bacteroidales bacterium]HPS17329.1 FliG C-terminal domain-containing protein [Bacteroidales bacterium]